MRGKKRRAGALLLTAAFGLVFLANANHLFSVEAVPLAQYLDYARAAADWTWEHYDEIIERWKKSFDPKNVFGYRPPGGLLETAVIDSFFFEKGRRPELAQRAKKILLGYEGFRSLYPEWAKRSRTDYERGVPALPDFFTAMRYIRAYDTLKKHSIFTPEEVTRVESVIADSMAYLLRTQEWGPMNRAVLRAESLAWAVRALPRHPQARIWEMQRRALGDDNWGNWQIEDATIYHGVWLYALLGYADVLGSKPDLFRTPEMTYYAHYFLNLMSPAGMVPDFGDASWKSNWPLFLVFFEAAAGAYKDPELKWAAATIARAFVDFENPTSVGLAYNLLDCARWGTDELRPRAPQTLSAEVMEDVQGKKIVFRNGWDDSSTYLLLNYRDEGDGGLNFRDYLRDTIPVEEEKMTHGHADENSIVLLMSRGSVLLHDGGYRDYMPSGPYGAYRQDYFHNRLCVRPEKIWLGQKEGEFRYSIRDAVPAQGLLDFLHNAGSYRRVRTQRVDFLTFPDFDYSRTRLIDDSLGYQWDRVIVYIKDPEAFVVFDIVKSLGEEYFTLANLWHTRQVVSRGEHWYDTGYDRIQNEELSSSRNLLIVFPLTHNRPEGFEPQKRHYQDEVSVYQVTAQHFERGGTAALATVLIPHAKEETPEDALERFRVLPSRPEKDVVGVVLQAGGKELTVAAKTDLRMDISRDWRRPRYTYESGRILFGGFETNGDLIFASLEKGTSLDYTIVNLTKALYRDVSLVEVESSPFGLSFDGNPAHAGQGKLRYWRDRAILPSVRSSKK